MSFKNNDKCISKYEMINEEIKRNSMKKRKKLKQM